VIFIQAVAIGPYTGGVINPSIGIALIAARGFAYGGDEFGYLWLYVMAPLCGAWAAYSIFEKYGALYKELENEPLKKPLLPK